MIRDKLRDFIYFPSYIQVSFETLDPALRYMQKTFSRAYVPTITIFYESFPSFMCCLSCAWEHSNQLLKPSALITIFMMWRHTLDIVVIIFSCKASLSPLLSLHFVPPKQQAFCDLHNIYQREFSSTQHLRYAKIKFIPYTNCTGQLLF